MTMCSASALAWWRGTARCCWATQVGGRVWSWLLSLRPRRMSATAAAAAAGVTLQACRHAGSLTHCICGPPPPPLRLPPACPAAEVPGTIQLQYTPLLTNPSHPFYYNVKMLSLAVDGQLLPVSQVGAGRVRPDALRPLHVCRGGSGGSGVGPARLPNLPAATCLRTHPQTSTFAPCLPAAVVVCCPRAVSV